jgi:pyruvate/2-oxoglutarate dehydrogenase complex dihydrolipoamide acyltransferase (E2) component
VIDGPGKNSGRATPAAPAKPQTTQEQGAEQRPAQIMAPQGQPASESAEPDEDDESVAADGKRIHSSPLVRWLARETRSIWEPGA